MRSVVRWCERILEACWLLAVAAVPLYFNPLSNNSFEPEKAVLFRALSLVGVVAWGVVKVGRPDEARSSEGIAGVAWLRRVRWDVRALCLVLVGMYALTQVVSTVLSIAPGISLAGSYERLQGSATMLAYLALFLIVVTSVRTRDQLDRLITMCLLASFPVAAYGIGQRLGLDPLISTGDESVVIWPVRSTFGNHIFVAAYLCMALPLTLARLVTRLRQAREAAGQALAAPVDNRETAVLAANAAIVIGVQVLLTVFLAASARWSQLWWGVLGILAIVSVLGLAMRPARSTRASLYTASLAYAILAAAQLLAIAFSQARGPWLGTVTAVFLLFFLLALRRKNRALTGSAIAGLAVVGIFVAVLNLPNSPLSVLKREPVFDRLSRLVDPTEGASRFRLVIWRHAVDLALTHPRIGPDQDPVNWLRPLVGYGPETFYLALPKITQQDLADAGGNFFEYDRAHNFLLDELTTTGALGLLLYVVIVGLGVLAGLRALWKTGDRGRQWLLAALLSSIGGHLVEAFFGIGVVGTLTLLWVFLALLAGPLYVGDAPVDLSMANAPTPYEQPARRAGKAPKSGKRRARAEDVSRRSGVERARPRPAQPLVGVGYVALTLLFCAAAAAWAPTGWPLGAQIAFFAWSLVGVALMLPASGSVTLIPRRRLSPSLLTALGVIVAAIILVADFKVSSADIEFKIGMSLSARGQTAALRWFQSAAAEYPRSVYFAAIGRMFMQAARNAPAGAAPSQEPSIERVLTSSLAQGTQMNRGTVFSYAYVALEQARRLSPLDAETYANLARLSHLRGELGEGQKLDDALDYYARAVELSPRTLRLYNEWARVYLSKSDYGAAKSRVMAALSLDQDYWMTHATLASILEVQGDKDGALDEAKTALKLGSHTWPKLAQNQLTQLSDAVLNLERKRGDS